MASFSQRLFYYKIQHGDTLQGLAKRYNTTVNSILSANPWLNPNNLCVGQLIAIYTGGYIPNNRPSNCIPQSVVKLRDFSRMLWEQHITWTRAAIIAIAEDSPDKDLVINRLLRNPSDMGEAIKPLYGNQVASVFTNLLKEHLVIASELVNAAKLGDTNTASDAERRWYENADQIATFINSVNPYLPKRDVLAMFHEHLALTKDEAVYRLNKEYERDIELYDEMEEQILEMADMFATGVAKQFPNKFLN
jgi:LysM domain